MTDHTAARRESVFALIDAIHASGMNLKGYCQSHGLNPAQEHWRAYRLGIRISVELRRRKILRALQMKRDNPHWTWSRIVLDCGFAGLSGFRRAQRQLKTRWGVDVEQELFASASRGP